MRALLAVGVAACGAPPPTAEVVAGVVTCGYGTHEVGGVCVPDPGATRYTIRARRQISAGGEAVDVVVSGTRPDGTPATDAIVLSTSRPAAGTFDPPALELDETHRRVRFTPCEASTPGCVGDVDLVLALASAPADPVARMPVELVATPGIGAVDPCLAGENVLYLEGPGFVHRGALTVVDGTFERNGGTQRGEVIVTPTDPLQGAKWTLEFNSVQLAMPLQPGVYRDAYQVPPFGKPGIKVFGANPFSVCSGSYRGEFQVHDYLFTTSLQRMTVSFRQWCDTNPNKMDIVTGCVHVE